MIYKIVMCACYRISEVVLNFKEKNGTLESVIYLKGRQTVCENKMRLIKDAGVKTLDLQHLNWLMATVIRFFFM